MRTKNTLGYLNNLISLMQEIRMKMYQLVSSDKMGCSYYYQLQNRLIRLENHYYFVTSE